MIENFSTPICCDNFMEFKTVFGNMVPSYYLFHCDECGGIMNMERKDMEEFEEEEQ